MVVLGERKKEVGTPIVNREVVKGKEVAVVEFLAANSPLKKWFRFDLGVFGDGERGKYVLDWSSL